MISDYSFTLQGLVQLVTGCATSSDAEPQPFLDRVKYFISAICFGRQSIYTCMHASKHTLPEEDGSGKWMSAITQEYDSSLHVRGRIIVTRADNIMNSHFK